MLLRLVREVKFDAPGRDKQLRSNSSYGYSYRAGTGVFAGDLIRDRKHEATRLYREGKD